MRHPDDYAARAELEALRADTPGLAALWRDTAATYRALQKAEYRLQRLYPDRWANYLATRDKLSA